MKFLASWNGYRLFDGEKEKMDTIQKTIYRTLKDGIITLTLEPGLVMSSSEIAKKMNASRTPVREACIKLQKEGLLSILPQRETLVSKIDLERMEQEVFIRSSLELRLIDKLKEHIKEIPLGKLQANLLMQESCIASNNY